MDRESVNVHLGLPDFDISGCINHLRNMVEGIRDVFEGIRNMLEGIRDVINNIRASH